MALMNLTDEILAKRMQTIIETEPPVAAMVEFLGRVASEVYLYGGTTRDIGLGLKVSELKDFDIVLRCNNLDAVADMVSDMGSVTRGPFRSVNLHSKSGLQFDISIISFFRNGIRPIHNIEDLLSLVDVSVNAIAYDCLNKRIIDPVNGVRDIAGGLLRPLLLDRPEALLYEFCPVPYPAILWFRYQTLAIKRKLTVESPTLRWLKAKQNYQAYQSEFEKFFGVPKLMDLDSIEHDHVGTEGRRGPPSSR